MFSTEFVLCFVCTITKKIQCYNTEICVGKRNKVCYIALKNSLTIQEQNTKKNHKRVVVLYVINNHVNLHKL
jgi:hypothetical protein